MEGRIQTRTWDDDRGQRHWKTEVVAAHVEMLSGRRKKDYDAESAATSLAAQATALGETSDDESPGEPSVPATEPVPEEATTAA